MTGLGFFNGLLRGHFSGVRGSSCRWLSGLRRGWNGGQEKFFLD